MRNKKKKNIFQKNDHVIGDNPVQQYYKKEGTRNIKKQQNKKYKMKMYVLNIY